MLPFLKYTPSAVLQLGGKTAFHVTFTEEIRVICIQKNDLYLYTYFSVFLHLFFIRICSN